MGISYGFHLPKISNPFDTLLPVSTLAPTHYESPCLTEEELNPHVSDSFA